MSSPAFAQQSSLLDAPWKFQLGDNATWAVPTFDDSQWDSIKVPSIIPQQHGKPTQGWYRVHFDAENINAQSPQALLIEYIRHTDETWLNGIKIGGEGHFEQPWQFTFTNPQGVTRFYPIPQGLLKTSNNVLAIKVSIGFGSAWGAMFPGGAGIIDGDVYLGDIEPLREKYQQSMVITSSLDTLFLTLSLIDLLIILLLLRHTLANARELKWLTITSLFMFTGAAGHDLFYLFHLDIQLNLLLFIALAGTPISMAMYFWALYRNVSQRIITIVFSIWLCTIMVILLPFPINMKPIAWYLLNLLIVLFFIYALVCIYTGIRNKRAGAIAQLIAVVCYLILIRTQGLPDVFLGHRNIQLGSMIYRYALLIAYLQHISHAQVHYKQLLSKVVHIVDDVRNSIARDLHDGVGQHLAAIKLHSQLAAQHQQEKFLKRIPPSVDNAIVELRRIINGLRPIQLSYTNISEAIQKEAEHLATTYQLSIQVNTEPITLDKHKETHIFRIFQEAIGNSIKHGKPTEITVYIEQKRKNLHLRIQDNGQGFNTKHGDGDANASDNSGFGFISLSERIAILDGKISIHSHDGQGTEVNIKIPLG